MIPTRSCLLRSNGVGWLFSSQAFINGQNVSDWWYSIGCRRNRWSWLLLCWDQILGNSDLPTFWSTVQYCTVLYQNCTIQYTALTSTSFRNQYVHFAIQSPFQPGGEVIYRQIIVLFCSACHNLRTSITTVTLWSSNIRSYARTFGHWAPVGNNVSWKEIFKPLRHDAYRPCCLCQRISTQWVGHAFICIIPAHALLRILFSPAKLQCYHVSASCHTLLLLVDVD